MLCTVLLGLLQTTWIVDAAAGPGFHFTDLPPAIAAASAGDTILVLPGAYSAIAMTGKGITIRGAGVGITVVTGPSHTVSSTPAGFVDLLSGLTIEGSFWANNAARITLLDCEFLGYDSAFSGSNALAVTGSEVFASRCRFVGGDAIGPPPPPPFGGPMVGGGAVAVQGGKFGACDCDFEGGSVAGVFAGVGTRTGGSGLAVVDSAKTRLDSCRLLGGNGGPVGSAAGLGGDGVFVRNDARLQIVGGSLDVVTAGIGGFPGAAVRLTNQSFYPPSTVVVHGPVTISGQLVGPVTTGATTLPKLEVAATTTASGETDSTQPVQITFDGLQPSAPFAFLLGFRAAYTAATVPLVGDVLIDVASSAFLVGTLDAAGRAQLVFTPISVFGGPLPFPLYMEFAVFDPNGDVRLSNLDARFYSL